MAAKPTGPSVSTPVAKLLKPAADKLGTNDIAGASDLVKQAQALPDLTDFDKYKINEFAGQIAIKNNDFDTASKAYFAMADSPALATVTPEEQAQTLRIATLLAADRKNYPAGIKYGKAFIALGGAHDAQLEASLAECYYYSGDYVNAEAMANAIVAATPAGTAPTRGAIEVLLYSQIKNGKQDAAHTTLETILTYYNDPDEWGQLLDVSLGVKGISTIQALHIYRLRFVVKATSRADDYSTAASSAISVQLPVEADAIVKAGSAAGAAVPPKLAADAAGRAATDRKTIGAFEGEAKKSPNGELDMRLAETYYGYGRYADAAEAARRALQKGGAKMDANEANMVLGESLLASGDTAGAQAAFNAVSDASAPWAKAKHLWLLYLGNKYAATAQK
jgi:tetratricopeptide (TPR) repeat protein